MSCCPPGSEGYLAPDYSTKGKIIQQGDVEFYTSNYPSQPTKNGIIIVPDVFGWNSGRTRAIADYLSEAGYLSVVPKSLVNTLEGGTDGDGLPPTFDFTTDGAKFPGFVRSNAWDTVKPRIVASINYLKSQGIEKIGAVGFCWGGWPIAVSLKDPDTSEVLFGINPHPSILAVNSILGEDKFEFLKGLRGPILLLPTSNDPDDYREGSDYFAALKKIQPESKTIDEFKAVLHGFVTRGDIKDPIVKEHVTKALEYIVQYANEQFSK